MNDAPEHCNVLAVIIGRAGSKGLPGKNARRVAGKPMICHTIEDAKQSGVINRVIVSTDGKDIAAAARSMDVEVIDRPAELSSDTATVDDAVRHAIKSIDSSDDLIAILYANVPVRPDDLIDRAVRTLIETRAASVQSYTPVGKYHPHWMMHLDDTGCVSPFIESTSYRRQDLPKLFIPDGGVIAVTRQSLFTIIEGQPHAFLGNDRRGIINPPGTVIDVDDVFDLEIAETKLRRLAKVSCEAQR